MAVGVSGVHHIAIIVNDLDAARRFYCDAFGMKEIPRPAFESEGFWVEIGAQQLHVSLGDESAPKRNHFALAVADIDAAVQHLERAGVSVRRGGDVAGAGSQAFTRDPSGNLLELNQQ